MSKQIYGQWCVLLGLLLFIFNFPFLFQHASFSVICKTMCFFTLKNIKLESGIQNILKSWQFEFSAGFMNQG